MLLAYTSGQSDVSVAMGTERELIPSAALLTDFTRAASQGLLMPDASGETRMAPLRRAVAQVLGEGALLDTAGVAAAFNAINKVADACGVKMDAMSSRHVETATKLLEHMDMTAPINWTSSAAHTE